MANKNINTRIIHKHDIETNWNKATNFIPMKGEIIVYDIDDTYNYERFKIGDGVTNVNNLPFAIDNINWNENDESSLAYVKNRTHYDTRKTETVTLTFDGNLDGKQTVLLDDGGTYLVKISNEPIPMADMIGAQISVYENGETSYISVQEDDISFPSEQIYRVGGGLVFVALEDTELDSFSITRGVWVICIKENQDYEAYTASLSYDIATGELKKLDEKYIPDSVVEAINEVKTEAEVQSDWNENDESSLAFVKNRPFYKDGYVGTIPFTATSETTLTYTTVENDEAISVIAPYFQSVLSQADACLVKIEGNSGEISCSFSRGYFSISGFITGSWFYGSGKDWTATITDENIVLSTGNTYNVEFYDLIDPYIKIDVRYMPNEVFTTSHAPIYYGNQDGSTIQGQGTIASGFCAHAEGNQSTASGDDSHAEGYKTEASGDCSHAEGSYSKATGGNAHASGNSTVANRKAMNVIGECNIYDEIDYTKEVSTTTVSLSRSSYYVAQNYSFSSSTGVFSLTNPITTDNLDSFIGWYVSPMNSTDNLSYIYYIAATTSTTNTYEVLMHKSNNKKVQRGQYVHVVGNGDYDAARSNAHTLDWSGNAWYAGDVYVGSTSGTNKDEGSKKLATEDYAYSKSEIDAIMGSYITDIDTLIGGA